MFTDTGTGIIVTDVHDANGFGAFRKSGEIKAMLGILTGNHLFGYIQARRNCLVDRRLHFFCFVICQGSIKVVVTL